MSHPRPRAHAVHLLVAGVAGLAVTVIEFAAVRFLAPAFGQSQYVWANVIGLILLALALGYWFGGRLADRSESARPLYLAYTLAALWIAGMAFLGGPLTRWLVPEGLGSERLLPLAFTGSLVATVLLFGPPMLVLGMTSPFFVRLDDAPGRAGRVAGRIFAVGTVGSLAGCYLAPLWLLQAAGSRLTILLAAAVLGVMGGLGLWRSPGRGAVLGALAVLLVAGATAHAALFPTPLRLEEGQIAEVESAYQAIRVVQAPAPALRPGPWPAMGDEVMVPTRFLRHDEDADTYQSVWLPEDEETLLTGGRYYEHLALGAWFERPEPKDRLDVLVIGYAGGSVHRILRATEPPGTRLGVLGVEIDPEVVEVARRHLGLGDLEDEDLRIVVGEDARTVVNALPSEQRFDLVLLDAYTRTTYVPFQLATVEFFALLAGHLGPGGWIGVNAHAVGGLGRSRLLRALAATMAAAEGLGPVHAVPNPLYPDSVVLWAGSGAAQAPRLLTSPAVDPRLLTPAFALERLGVVLRPRPCDPVLTDDRSAIDRLTDLRVLGP